MLCETLAAAPAGPATLAAIPINSAIIILVSTRQSADIGADLTDFDILASFNDAELYEMYSEFLLAVERIIEMCASNLSGFFTNGHHQLQIC